MLDTGARAVVDRYLGAMASGDRPTLWDCFAEDMRFLCEEFGDDAASDGGTAPVRREQRLRGRDEFAEEWERMLQGVFVPGSYVRHNDAVFVDGDLVIVVWRADCLGTEITHGVTHFVVRDGRIAVMSAVVRTREV